MDMQKPGPRGRSSSINPGPGVAVECKTPAVARGGCWCLELTDALYGVIWHSFPKLPVNQERKKVVGAVYLPAT